MIKTYNADVGKDARKEMQLGFPLALGEVIRVDDFCALCEGVEKERERKDFLLVTVRVRIWRRTGRTAGLCWVKGVWESWRRYDWDFR